MRSEERRSPPNATPEIVFATTGLIDATPEFFLATSSPLPIGSAAKAAVDLSDHEATTPVHIPSFDAQTEGQEDTPIFIRRMPALLPSPVALFTPPRAPKARRKTLAGVTGLQLICHSPRLQAKNRNMPIAKLAEKLLCHRMGIVAEGEQITEAAIAKFASLFQGRRAFLTLRLLHFELYSGSTVILQPLLKKPWSNMEDREDWT